jgi:lipopolysaccharide export system protein LptA
MNRHINSFITGLLLLAGSSQLHALPEDRRLPIDVFSEDYTQDVARGVMSYVGAAKITQGNLMIEAERIDVTFTDRNVTKIVAEGSPARLTDLPEEGADLIIAEGNKVEYLIEEDQVSVGGAARFSHQGSEITAEQIVFDLSEGAAVASGGVRHVIQPPKPESNEEE